MNQLSYRHIAATKAFEPDVVRVVRGEPMFWKRKVFTYAEERESVIQSIRDFLAGTGGDYGWDDFISYPTGYSELDAVRGFCLELPAKYPPNERTEWCNPDGLRALIHQVERLEAERDRSRR